MCPAHDLLKIQDAKMTQKSPSAHHRTTLSGYIFETKACIDNQKKNLLSSSISSTCSHNMVNFGRPTSGWDRFRSLGHPSKFQRVLRLVSVTGRHSSRGRQQNFAALNRGCHLYLTAAITLGAHSSYICFLMHYYITHCSPSLSTDIVTYAMPK